MCIYIYIYKFRKLHIYIYIYIYIHTYIQINTPIPRSAVHTLDAEAVDRSLTHLYFLLIYINIYIYVNEMMPASDPGQSWRTIRTNEAKRNSCGQEEIIKGPNNIRKVKQKVHWRPRETTGAYGKPQEATGGHGKPREATGGPLEVTAVSSCAQIMAQ